MSRSAELALVEAVLSSAAASQPATTWLPRPEQQVDPGDTLTLITGGRGSGKTAAGARWLAETARQHPGTVWAVVAPRYAHARDVCVEGRSGLLRELGEAVEPRGWNRSLGQIRLRNGTQIFIDGADDGALRIQGENLSGAWLDEVGLWRGWKRAWTESVRFAVRMAPAQIVATGTPKAGHPLVRQLSEEADRVTVMSTLDNIANLDGDYVADLVARFEGSRLGEQELHGRIIDEMEGALWERAWVERSRVVAVPELRRVTVGVDPADTGTIGIVAVGEDVQRRLWVLEDASLTGVSGERWAAQVAAVHARWGGQVVAERDWGGDAIRVAIQSAGHDVPVELVKAQGQGSKAGRALSVATLWELDPPRGGVVGQWPLLEDQMCTWVEGESTYSPDRLDAMVHACRHMMDLGAGTATVQMPDLGLRVPVRRR